MTDQPAFATIFMRLKGLFTIAAVLALAAQSHAGVMIQVRQGASSDLQRSSLGSIPGLRKVFNPQDKALAAKLGLDRWYASSQVSDERLARLKKDAGIAVARQSVPVYLAAQPNDPLFSSQWALKNNGQPWGTAGADIDAVRAWDITTGSPSVIIAIIDTGIDNDHTDLAPRLVAGKNLVDGSTNTDDDQGHGTSCAGIAAAAGNNNLYISGVTWNCKLMPVKVIAASGSGEDEWLANGIIWAADHGAKVLSISLVLKEDVEVVRSAVQYAIAKGSVVLAAMGNDASDRIRYPAAIADVIGVGASDRADSRANFSNWGAHIDVVAPGVNLLTTSRGGGSTEFSGTSAATPCAAGVCALILSAYPSLTVSQVGDILRLGSEDVGDYGFDIYTGAGRVNAYLSLKALEDTTPPTPVEVADSGNYTTTSTSLAFSWSPSSDPESGVAGYEYAIGTLADPVALKQWTWAGLSTSATVAGLTLAPEVSYIATVRAKSGVNRLSDPATSDGIIYAPTVQTIGQARQMDDGRHISLIGKVASASFPDRGWVTEPNRSAAIALDGPVAMGEGDLVRVSGQLATIGCIRSLVNSQVWPLGSANVPEPVGMNNRALGGKQFFTTPGVTGAQGLNNIGLLVRTWGRVTAVGAGYLYLDDGSGLLGPGLEPGLKVLTNGWLQPETGWMVSVIGILECDLSGSISRPEVRIRKDADIQRLD